MTDREKRYGQLGRCRGTGHLPSRCAKQDSGSGATTDISGQCCFRGGSKRLQFAAWVSLILLVVIVVMQQESICSSTSPKSKRRSGGHAHATNDVNIEQQKFPTVSEKLRRKASNAAKGWKKIKDKAKDFFLWLTQHGSQKRGSARSPNTPPPPRTNTPRPSPRTNTSRPSPRTNTPHSSPRPNTPHPSPGPNTPGPFPRPNTHLHSANTPLPLANTPPPPHPNTTFTSGVRYTNHERDKSIPRLNLPIEANEVSGVNNDSFNVTTTTTTNRNASSPSVSADSDVLPVSSVTPQNISVPPDPVPKARPDPVPKALPDQVPKDPPKAPPKAPPFSLSNFKPEKKVAAPALNTDNGKNPKAVSIAATERQGNVQPTQLKNLKSVKGSPDAGHPASDAGRGSPSSPKAVQISATGQQGSQMIKADELKKAASQLKKVEKKPADWNVQNEK